MKLPSGITEKSNGKFKVQMMVQGKRPSATVDTFEAAMEVRARMLKGLHEDGPTAGTYKTMTLGDALDQYIARRVSASVSEQIAAKQLKWYRKTIGEHFGYTTPLDDISVAAVNMFSDELLKRKYANTTINYVGSILYQSMKFAYERGKMKLKPKRMTCLKQKVGRVRFLSKDEEFDAVNWFNRMCMSEYKDLFLFYVETGMRKTEALNLRWNDIDLKTKRMTIWKNKTNKPRTVKMTPIVREMLARGQLRRPNDGKHDDKIFGHINERHFYRTWLRMKEAIGLEDDNQFVIHMLRHTCCTRLIEAGVDLRSVMEWMGHSSLDITQRYAHFVPERLDHAADKLAELRSGTI